MDYYLLLKLQETAAKETLSVCCSTHSKAEEREGSYDCGGSNNEKEDVTPIYSQVKRLGFTGFAIIQRIIVILIIWDSLK